MPFTLSFDTATPAGLADLDTFIKGRSYVIGFSATQTDVTLFTALGKAPDAAKYPNLARYYSHIASFSADARSKLPAGFGAAPAKATGGAGKKAAAPAPAPAADDDDAAGLFDDDDGAAAKKVTAAAKAAPKPAETKKKEKAPLIEKTAVVYEIKTMNAGQDMDLLRDSVRSIVIDGLVWGEQMKVVDVAFGIQKLVVQAVIEDEKVSLEDIEDRIKGLTGLTPDEENPEGRQVQSVDLNSMNKVT